MITATDRYKRMLRDEVAPVLRRMGFQGSGPNFRLPDAEEYLLLSFQASTSSTADEVKFTVNLAVINKADWEAQQQAWWGRPSATTQGPIGEYERLGILMPDGDDIWWQISAHSETADASADVCAAIRTTGIPALRSGLNDTN